MWYVRSKRGANFMTVHVDDCFMTASTDELLSKLIDLLNDKFECHDVGSPKQHLGMQVFRDLERGIIRLSQRVFTADLLREYGMERAKGVSTPLPLGAKLLRDEGDVLDESEHPYKSVVGAVGWLANCTRPDLRHAHSVMSGFSASPRVPHWQAAMHVLRYIAGTSEMGIQFGHKRGLQVFCGC